MSLDITARAEYGISLDEQLLSKLQHGKSDGVGLFTVRYGFRPDSLDPDSSLSLEKLKDEYILTSNGETDNHVFRGQGVAAKDVECVLVFDQEKSSFQLRPLDFTLRVNPSRQKVTNNGSTKSNQMHTQNSMSRRANSSSRSPSTSSGSHSRSLSPVNSNPNSGGSSSSSSDTLKVKSKIKSSSSTSRTQIASKKPPSTGKVAKKSVPSKRPVAKKSTMKHTISPTTTVTDDGEVSAQSEQSSDHYDVDDDLLGALANELEESLEDNSNDSGGSKKEVESEQEDSDYQAIQVVESKNRNIPDVSSTVTSTFSSPALGTGPMSLRGFADSSRRDEDDLSSSEEE